MESMMNMLKELTFAAVPRENSLSPQQKRRNKLIAHLREQLAMAEAEIDGRIHVVKKRRSQRRGEGRRRAVPTPTPPHRVGWLVPIGPPP